MIRERITQHLFVIILFILSFRGSQTELTKNVTDNPGYKEALLRKVNLWAPLIWLAPEEEFFPSSTKTFLSHVQPWSPENPTLSSDALPTGSSSQSWFLKTKKPLDYLLRNKSSIIYGQQPENKRVSVPAYAQVTKCEKTLYFHVTYWLFFPYSQGKEVCTMNLGPLGPWPIPMVNERCLGKMKEFGNHVGDWEHMSLYFKEGEKPSLMYISAHDAGAFYKFEPESKRFLFQRQEIRVGVLQRPSFPKVVNLISGSHPELFSAKGSHGLWAAPGKHKYVRIPRLYDESGFGTPWATWQSLIILNDDNSEWLKFRGRWGNPKSQCHPLAKTICQQSDGPTGIPMKKQHFSCAQ